MTKICVLIMSCFRYDYLEATLKSFFNKVNFSNLEVEYHLFEDRISLFDPDKLEEICGRYGINNIHISNTHIGLSKSVSTAWKKIPECDYIWHQENDFKFMERINVMDIVEIFEHSPLTLRQIALLRNPVYDFEREAGGIIPFYNNKMVDYAIDIGEREANLVLHKMFFTLNPTLYPYSITLGAPDFENAIEREFRNYLMAKKPESWFAYYGARNDDPRILHIGDYRIGSGY